MRFKECGDDCVDCEECTCICVCSPFFSLKSRTSVAAGHSNVSYRKIHSGKVQCRPFNSLLLLRPLLNQLLSLLFSCTLYCSTIIGDDRSGWFLYPGVSFLSLDWASTVDYEVLHSDGHFRVKDKVLIFSTHLFILSIRLFAVALFTVSYKWWVTSVLILHCTVITICDIVWLCRGRGRNEWEQLWEVFKSFFYWFHRGYEMIFQYKQITSKKETKRNI